MSRKFLAGTALYAYECMMQELPYAGQAEESDRRMKLRYMRLLKQFLLEYGYEQIAGKVLMAMDKFLFDTCIFLDAVHRDTFWDMYGKHVKSASKKDNGRAAVIYLLSAKEVFKTILVNYVSDPLFALPTTVAGCCDEESYDIYQAVKTVAGMESGLCEEDLFEEGLIEEKVLSLMIISKWIAKYGIAGCVDRQNRKRRSDSAVSAI